MVTFAGIGLIAKMELIARMELIAKLVGNDVVPVTIRLRLLQTMALKWALVGKKRPFTALEAKIMPTNLAKSLSDELSQFYFRNSDKE